MLSPGDLGEGIWRASSAEVLGRWSGALEPATSAGDVSRYSGTLAIAQEDLLCAVTWTFSEDRLVVLALRPLGGRGRLDDVLRGLGVDPRSLHSAGEGLFSVQAQTTRFDVDRLDSVISLYEVGG